MPTISRELTYRKKFDTFIAAEEWPHRDGFRMNSRRNID